MAFDDNTLNATLSSAVTNEYTETNTNSLDVEHTVTDSGNTVDSTNDSYNDTRNADGSFHWGSYNTETDTAHSGNTDSYNDTATWTDSSQTDNSDNSTHDDSVNAGVRSYSTGFGDLGGAAAAAGGGDMMIDNRSTIVDQSVNGNIAASGPVFTTASSSAVVNSGDDAIVAGGDANVTYDIDESLSIDAGGDILMDGSTKTVNSSINSDNDYSFTSTINDSSQDWDVTDSNNTYTWSETVSGSYNDDALFDSTTTVDVDIDAIVDSVGSGIGDADLGM